MENFITSIDWKLILRLGVGLPLALGALVVGSRALLGLRERLHELAVERVVKRATVKVQGQTLITEDTARQAARVIVQGLYLLAMLAFVLIIANVTFALIPATEALAGRALGLLGKALSALALGLLNAVPALVGLVAIFVFTWGVLWTLEKIFEGFQSGLIVLPGFHTAWASPTYKLLRVLVVMLAVLVGIQTLPIADSAAFKGASLFIGILFSLGSTVIVAQFMSGLVLTYTRAFAVGDYISVAGHTGVVTETTLFVTRLRTPKQLEVAIPNALVLGSPVLNWSERARTGDGVALYTSVTIGYAVPWRQVHELLLGAAKKVEGVVEEPKPYVLQRGLQDFYVEYQLNVFTRAPEQEPRLLSDLHQAIQDDFFTAGVEIMSPHYGALRDGNRAEIPDANLPAGYRIPGFRLDRG